MTCAACIAYDAAERAAIEGRSLDVAEDGVCTCDGDREMDVLFVAPEQFTRKPQIGTTRRLTWDELEALLYRPSVARVTGDDDADKAQAGALSPALYSGSVRRQSRIVAVYALAVDVDGGGDVDTAAALLGGYRCLIHSTFKSSPLAPRCRIFIELLVPVDAPTYRAVHRIVRAHLSAAGLVLDDGASDASRLCYLPMTKPGAEYGFRSTSGRPLDAAQLLAAQPRPSQPRAAKLVEPKHANKYKQGALRAAATALRSAVRGDRHHALLRAAWGLSRPELGLEEEEIAHALLPAFVAVAGEAREAEAVRAIADTFAARRCA